MPQNEETLLPAGEYGLADLVPREWRDAGTTSVWIRLYRAFRVDTEELTGAFATKARTRDLRIVVLVGRPPYPKRGTVTLVSETEWRIEIAPEMASAPEGAYVLLIAPFASGTAGDEPSTVRLLDAAAGALAAVCGRNAVFERVSEYEFHLDDRATSREPVWENPLAFAPPRLGERHKLVYALLKQVLEDSDDLRRAKAMLSLRWLESATRSHGVDAYLKYWIALETLCMTSYGDLSRDG